MNPPPGVDPGHQEIQRAHESSVSQSTRPSTGPSLSVFNHANNISMNNSSIDATIYNTISGSSAAPSLDILYKSVAPNAILNAGGRADEVRCHPGTREEVIGIVEKSITAQDYTYPRMLWLSGPAGAGKSAIMQTVADRCEERGVPHANFFFFRADSSRNDASAFVATIIHQIIQLYPAVGPRVAAVLASNPLLFQTALQKQFGALIHRTFPIGQDSPSVQPLALLIDGLDECDSENKTAQRQLLQALDTLVLQDGLYFRVVVASRVEPQISMAFKQLRSQIDSIFLNEDYSPEKDIHIFVTAEFDKIKATHHLSHTLGQDWPSASDIDGIVSKSSGQFIYAATVMRFIAQSPASPVLSLQKAQGIIPPHKNTPFAQLDAIYAYILGQVDDLEAVKAIFAVIFLRRTFTENVKYLLKIYLPRLSSPVVDSCISELTPLIDINSMNDFQFFHAFFPDFLKDRTRAGVYYIDLEDFCTAGVPRWWMDRGGLGEISYNLTAQAFRHIKNPTPEITTALMQPYPGTDYYTYPSRHRELVSRLHKIYSPHDLGSFIKIIQRWLIYDPSLADDFPEDILRCITLESDAHMCQIDAQNTSM